MKVAVIGSRTFSNYDLLRKTLNSIHAETKITEIVSGGADGADTLAENFAGQYNIKLKVFKSDWNDMTEPCKVKVNKIGREYNSLAGFKRNTQIIDRCDMVVAFWDGKSPGTKDSLKKAKDKNKKIRIITF